jgi:hypothetical protein
MPTSFGGRRIFTSWGVTLFYPTGAEHEERIRFKKDKVITINQNCTSMMLTIGRIFIYQHGRTTFIYYCNHHFFQQKELQKTALDIHIVGSRFNVNVSF